MTSFDSGDGDEALRRGDRRNSFLLPECVDDDVSGDNPVRVIEAFVDEPDLAELGFARATPAETGRPGYHPPVLLKLYLYGYLNRVPSSRRLERDPDVPPGKVQRLRSCRSEMAV